MPWPVCEPAVGQCSTGPGAVLVKGIFTPWVEPMGADKPREKYSAPRLKGAIGAREDRCASQTLAGRNLELEAADGHAPVNH